MSKQQAKEIEMLHQQLKKKGSVKHFVKKHWRPIVIVGSSIAIPAGRYLYKNGKTEQELGKTQKELKLQQDKIIDIEDQSKKKN